MKEFRFALVVLCLFLVAAQIDFSIDDTELPYNDSVNLTLNFVENSTANISLVNVSSRMNVSWDEVVSFGDNVTSRVATFDLFIADFLVLNDTEEYAWFNITNSVSNNSVLYGIVVGINSTVNFSDEISEFNISLSQGNYFIDATTDVLPKNGSLRYSVTGIPNRSLNISCVALNHSADWLSCPNSSVFGSSGVADFSLAYLIPFDASPGVRSWNVTFVAGNDSLTRNVSLNVSLPELALQRYVYSDDCFVEVEGQEYLTVKYECIQEAEEFNIRRLSTILDRERQLRSNLTQCTPEVRNVTDYVVVGDVDQELHEELKTCRNERANQRADLRDWREQYRDLEQNYTSFRQQYVDNESSVLKQAFSAAVTLNEEAKQIREENRRTIRNTVLTILGSLLIGFGGLYAYRKRKENTEWRIR